MRAEKVIRSLLMAASGVTALVSDRAYPHIIPQGATLPALAVEHISTVDLFTLDASAAYGLTQSRIQVTAIAKDYVTQKALLEEVRKACTYQRGTIAGVGVVSVLRDGVGPDIRDDDVGIFTQSVDFLVTYREP